MHKMLGDHAVAGMTLTPAGFMHPALNELGTFAQAPSSPIYRSAINPLSEEQVQFLNQLERGEVTGDVAQISQQLGVSLNELVRGVQSGMTAFPVRENLEAEAKVLVPKDTPVRNLLPRTMGNGLASNWRQISSLGGGWGTPTGLDQPGGGTTRRLFFSESINGAQAPSESTTVYANRTATYRLMGAFGSITGLAMAAGANYQNQLAVEKANCLTNLMLNEEFALLCSVASGGTDMYGVASTAAPWGDGTNSLGFDGLWASIATANGTPSTHIQAAVGQLTLSHIDTQLTRMWRQGGRDAYMIVNSQEVLSLVRLAQADGSVIRVNASRNADAVLGMAVTNYKHPITGELVPIYVSRFMEAGSMIFGSKYLPDGSPAADVQVLPQVALPELAPHQNVMGYVAQELAPSTTAPQVYPFIITVYEVFRMKGATVFARSEGVTAA